MTLHISVEQLRNKFEYNKDTGYLIRKTGYMAGKIVGYKSKRGYLVVSIGGTNKRYYVHRLAFIIVTGIEPKLLDHINRDKIDNRWCNLRETTKSINTINSRRKISSSSGYKGIYILPSGNFNVKILKINIGTFNDIEEAIIARNDKFIEIFGEEYLEDYLK